MPDSSGSRPFWEGDYVWRPAGDEPQEPSYQTRRPVPEPPQPILCCWRCGKDLRPGDEQCMHCFAWADKKIRRARAEAETPTARLRVRHDSDLIKTITFFGVFLLVNVIYILIAFRAASEQELTSERMQKLIYILSGIDSVLVLIAVFLVRPPKTPTVTATRRALGWGIALPVLAAAFGINWLYHHWLTQALDLDATSDVTDLMPMPLAVLFICVQPAIFEELFFRYLTLGVFRRHMGMHAAVLVSSVMFGFAHLGAILSIPVLILVGLALGYLYVTTGDLILPMILHFLHNLAVVLMS